MIWLLLLIALVLVLPHIAVRVLVWVFDGPDSHDLRRLP